MVLKKVFYFPLTSSTVNEHIYIHIHIYVQFIKYDWSNGMRFIYLISMKRVENPAVEQSKSSSIADLSIVRLTGSSCSSVVTRHSMRPHDIIWYQVSSMCVR